jgi:hypothetical protein
MPAVPRPASATAAEASSSSNNNNSSKLTMAKGNESLASIKSKEAAFYGVDSEDFTDRGTSRERRGRRNRGREGGREGGLVGAGRVWHGGARAPIEVMTGGARVKRRHS